jgi:DNA repair protein RadC
MTSSEATGGSPGQAWEARTEGVLARKDVGITYTIPGLRVSLVREDGVKMAEKPEASTPEGVARIVSAYLGDADREHFVALLLNIRHRVLGINTVSIGNLTGSLVHPRELFKSAILACAAAIVVAHNHPSGDPEPSAEDIALTRRLSAAGSLLGIELLDHVVVGERGAFVSLRTRGVI